MERRDIFIKCVILGFNINLHVGLFVPFLVELSCKSFSQDSHCSAMFVSWVSWSFLFRFCFSWGLITCLVRLLALANYFLQTLDLIMSSGWSWLSNSSSVFLAECIMPLYFSSWFVLLKLQLHSSHFFLFFFALFGNYQGFHCEGNQLDH